MIAKPTWTTPGWSPLMMLGLSYRAECCIVGPTIIVVKRDARSSNDVIARNDLDPSGYLVGC